MSRAPAPDPRLASVLRRLRAERGLTLEALAFKSDVSIGSLGRIERGRSSAAWSTVVQIAGALDVSMAELGAAVGALDTRTPLDDLTIATLERYVEHLRRLSKAERQEARDRGARTAAATPEQAPRWIVLQGEWALLGLRAKDPITALREAVAASTDDPEDVQRVIAKFDAIAALSERRRQGAALILEAEAATAPPEETRRALWKYLQELIAADVSDNLRKSAERACAVLDAIPYGERVSPEFLAILKELRSIE